jgi:hypothetical protein
MASAVSDKVNPSSAPGLAIKSGMGCQLKSGSFGP